ncbi:MAG TPA: RidA family protein [Rhizomicrobium sp.]|nr:RidA family protein [Rhizomicrobium sp.]
MSLIESRLKELGVTLPTPPLPVASYVPCTISGNIVFVSGQIPIADGAIKYVGKLGVDVPMEAGQAAAQLCAINVLAQLKSAIGDLDRVVKCLKLGVFINAAPDYSQHPEVANGASDLIAAVFGDAGKHARAAVGVGSLPRGVAVEVEAIFEIK